MTTRENARGVETTSLTVNPETIKDLLVAVNHSHGQAKGATTFGGSTFQHATPTTFGGSTFQHVANTTFGGSTY